MGDTRAPVKVRADLHLDLDEVVSLVCLNSQCRFNLLPGAAACNLKRIALGDEGQCLNFERRNSLSHGEIEIPH